jgi:hypothetical protein
MDRHATPNRTLQRDVAPFEMNAERYQASNFYPAE